MSRIWRRLLENHSTRREGVLIDALRMSPQPVAPEGLRDRLRQDALAASAQATPRPVRRSLLWPALATGTVVVAVGLACRAWLGQPTKRVTVRATHPTTAIRTVKPPVDVPDQQQIVHDATKLTPVQPRSHRSHRKHVAPLAAPTQKPPGKDTPVMVVTVTRVPTDEPRATEHQEIHGSDPRAWVSCLTAQSRGRRGRSPPRG